MNLFGILFVRGDAEIGDTDIRHETVHTEQMKELLYVFFYLWYAAEWLVRLVQERNARRAYRRISFEREAYFFQGDEGYLSRRKRFAWRDWL